MIQCTILENITEILVGDGYRFGIQGNMISDNISYNLQPSSVFLEDELQLL